MSFYKEAKPIKKVFFCGFDDLFLFLGIAFFPLYLFDSGNIQLAHFFLISFSIFVVLKFGFYCGGWFFLLFSLSFYVFFVEFYYLCFGGGYNYLINPAYMFYNLFVVMAVYVYCRSNGLSFIFLGLAFAALIIFFVIVYDGFSFRGENAVRVKATFNNPNQLGYFSVCFFSMSYLLFRHSYINSFFACVLLSFSCFLSIVSLSKAAILSNFIASVFLIGYCFLKIMDSGLFKIRNLFYFFVFSSLFIYFVFLGNSLGDFYFVERFSKMAEESDSSLESRGYFAFKEGTVDQIIFGLGENEVLKIVGHEVHSTLGSIFNNYGAVGFLIFLFVLFLWFLNLWKAYGFVGMFCLVGPVILYGVTHNGIRFTLFWILFGSSMAMADSINKIKK